MVNGGLLSWYLPFLLLRGEGTWIALAVVDSRVLPLLSKITYIYIYISEMSFAKHFTLMAALLFDINSIPLSETVCLLDGRGRRAR